MEVINQSKLKKKKKRKKAVSRNNPPSMSLLWGLTSSLKIFLCPIILFWPRTQIFPSCFPSFGISLAVVTCFVCLPTFGEQCVPKPQVFTGTSFAKTGLHAASQCVSNHLQCHLHRVFEAEIHRVMLKSLGAGQR